MKIAIIFAAGFGKRLLPITKKKHKSLIKFYNLPIIEHIINNLLANKLIKEIIIITGYLHDSFTYLATKYNNLTIINNNNFATLQSAYVLDLIKDKLPNNDFYFIAGDFIMLNNCFVETLTTNVMAALKRPPTLKKEDWSYQLNNNKQIIAIVKSKENDLLASEWSYINHKLANLIYYDLTTNKPDLSNLILAKYLLQIANTNKMHFKPYLINPDYYWDLDDYNDLKRLISATNNVEY